MLVSRAAQGLCGGLAAFAIGSATVHGPTLRLFSVSAASPTSLHDFTVKNIDGEQVDLAVYKGRACVVVNVASR